MLARRGKRNAQASSGHRSRLVASLLSNRGTAPKVITEVGGVCPASPACRTWCRLPSLLRLSRAAISTRRSSRPIGRGSRRVGTGLVRLLLRALPIAELSRCRTASRRRLVKVRRGAPLAVASEDEVSRTAAATRQVGGVLSLSPKAARCQSPKAASLHHTALAVLVVRVAIKVAAFRATATAGRKVGRYFFDNGHPSVR